MNSVDKGSGDKDACCITVIQSLGSTCLRAMTPVNCLLTSTCVMPANTNTSIQTHTLSHTHILIHHVYIYTWTINVYIHTGKQHIHTIDNCLHTNNKWNTSYFFKKTKQRLYFHWYFLYQQDLEKVFYGFSITNYLFWSLVHGYSTQEHDIKAVIESYPLAFFAQLPSSPWRYVLSNIPGSFCACFVLCSFRRFLCVWYGWWEVAHKACLQKSEKRSRGDRGNNKYIPPHSFLPAILYTTYKATLFFFFF